MEDKDIIEETKKRYLGTLGGNQKSFDCGITKENNTIFIVINETEYSITRQALADEPSVGDEMANKIWSWILS